MDDCCSFGFEFTMIADFTLINATGQTIPAGTPIYWCGDPGQKQ